MRTLIVMALLCGLTACSEPAPAPQPPRPTEKRPDDYAYPADHSGFGEGPVDQPVPVPSANWAAWDFHPSHGCAWVPDGLFAGITSDSVRSDDDFCSFTTAEGNSVQIRWGGAFVPFNEPTAFMEATTVAGLYARFYDRTEHQAGFPGACQLQVDTRSVVPFTVLHRNEERKPLDRQRSCQAAHQVAERVAKRMVPLAGGQVWSVTPQRPHPAFVHTGVCDIADSGTFGFVGIDIPQEQLWQSNSIAGQSTCTARTGGPSAEVLLTFGPAMGLAEIRLAAGAAVTSQVIGDLAARQEIVGTSCAFAVEFVPGKLLRASYTGTTNDGSGCLRARAIVVVTISGMLDQIVAS
ncbi:hypothetical protein LWC34_52275 [Kibdelosporangium philippinense]|uniref:Uncharacterized protein n=1 Tax=Kibdelosporangium philippinense TaxID=211113 RepID=A0ABS8ZUQ1_9PSEU|nr:hypothetical protein [Kibdelosporangium philippinense]MCE7011332.1 hypothetical protein [Kibdelosporangium philippinense]